MKRVISVVLSLFLFISVPVKAQEIKKPSVSAEAYILYCVNNSSVILSANAHKRLGMASTTKIMTSLIALEVAENKDPVVTFSKDMEAEGSSMYLKAGDKLRLSDLATGMMTVSGNDAANAVALTLSDSFEGFAVLMNERGKELGMNDTNFVTPSGLSDDEHYSTAYDMALLMETAMNNKAFAELTSKKSVEVEFINPRQKVSYTNHNRLLTSYPYCIGGKTGYTQSTGRCLVTCSEKDGLRFICVTLNAPDDWNDHKALYDYGFAEYSAVTSFDNEDFFVNVLGGNSDIVKVCAESVLPVVVDSEDKEKVVRAIYLEPCVFAPVMIGVPLGKVVYSIDDEVISEISLVADASVVRVNLGFYTRIIKRLFS